MRYALIHEMLGVFLVKLSVWLKKKKNKVAHDEGSNLRSKDKRHSPFHYATS